MFYIQKDGKGEIIRVDDEPFAGMTAYSAEDTPEIQDWYRTHLQQSDLEMVRVLEDLIQVLMEKGVLSITDFPAAAQMKLIARAQAREVLNGSLTRLIGDDEGTMP
ncbi:MAG: hypothetical protein XXXJIFNMEKO3_03366 [Candidatus Erwinia impunctatus]|nr:hypothetical protein XXXJIFNMEKO_03366 [Culicoides impunctatus]